MGQDDDDLPHPFRQMPSPPHPQWQRVDRAATPMAGPQPVSAGEVAAGSALVLGLAAADYATGGLLGLVAAVGRFSDDADDSGAPAPKIPADLHLSAPPQLGSDGQVACRACQRRVPYASMVLNEHGYFCSGCGDLQPAR